MGSILLRFFQFWYSFIVGDDWTVAAGVIAALVVTSQLAHRGVAAWWLMPAAVVLLLAASVQRAARASH